MVYPLDQVLIVMPAFNESEVIAEVIAEVRSCLPDVTILVVNDGSSDDTATVARRAGAIVADLPHNLGVGGAVRCGFQYAVRNGFPVAVQLDSDGQHDPRSVPELVALLRGDGATTNPSTGEADIVIGARFAGVGTYEVRGPRKWAMRLLSSILSRTVGTRLSDTTSGFKAHGPFALEVFANDYPAEYLGDTIEALVIGSRAGLVVRQVPVEMRERAGGTPSHNPLKAAVYLARAFMALLIAYLRPSISRGTA
ncbi:glycosyltransferase family 2 protein [Leucobacter sp. W1153]|uniref:glycosyltransferase family 2 protein n=1 Tax=Leucobacter sp. W1153 TaxID=3439064 RepID=UPI003F418A8C